MSIDKTIFSRIPSILEKTKIIDPENQKISYWLEKLHLQREHTKNNVIAHNKIKNSKKESQKKIEIQSEENFTQTGIDNQSKNSATKKESDKQIVNDLVKKSNRLIISISSSFPFSFFKDTIEVEESRVTFKFNQFLSYQSHSVDIKDISNVFIESSMFFATLQIVSRTYIKNEIKIGYLNKKKARLVQRIIEGLRTFSEHKINTSHYEINELIAKIGEFHIRSSH